MLIIKHFPVPYLPFLNTCVAKCDST